MFDLSEELSVILSFIWWLHKLGRDCQLTKDMISKSKICGSCRTISL